MSTIFTRILNRELPGRFVWEDEVCARLSDHRPDPWGHTSGGPPRREIDHWLDAPPDLVAHLMDVAQTIGGAIDAAYSPNARSGLMIAGLEVPHLHIHVLPIDGLGRSRLLERGRLNDVRTARRGLRGASWLHSIMQGCGRCLGTDGVGDADVHENAGERTLALLEQAGEHLKVAATNRQHPTVEILAHDLDRSQKALEYLGTRSCGTLDRPEIDLDTSTVPGREAHGCERPSDGSS